MKAVKNNPTKLINKRLARVEFSINYVVDPNDQKMIQRAKECIYEDIESLIKNNELWGSITLESDPKAKESDIPSFLTENPNYENEI